MKSSEAYILEGTDPMLDGKMVIAIKQLAPGLRLRQQVPPNMAQGLFATLDEDQTRRMWESCIGA